MPHACIQFCVSLWLRLHGSLPESLGMLLYLTNINLDNNNFTVRVCEDLSKQYVCQVTGASDDSKISLRVNCQALYFGHLVP